MEEFSTVIMAMIIGVIPIFFIPAVLRRSLSAAGNIGAKISGFGQKAGAKLGGMGGKALEHNERYANWKNNMADKAKLRAAEKTLGRKSANSISRARAAATIDKIRGEESDAETILARREFANQSDHAIETAWEEARDSRDMKRLGALTNVLAERQGAKATSNFLSKQMKGYKEGDKEVAPVDLKNNAADREMMTQLQATLQRNSNLSSKMMDVAPGTYDMISSAGKTTITGEDGKKYEQYGDYNHFVANTGIPTKDTDYAKMSSQSWKDFAEANPEKARAAAQLVLNSSHQDVKAALSSEGREELLRRISQFGENYDRTQGPV